MAKKEKLGKNKLLIETPSGTVLEGSPDLEGLAKLYADWQSAISGVGKEELFIVNNVNLFQMFLEQGVSGRTMGNPSPKNPTEGGVKIDEIIRNIIDGGHFPTLGKQTLHVWPIPYWQCIFYVGINISH